MVDLIEDSRNTIEQRRREKEWRAINRVLDILKKIENRQYRVLDDGRIEVTLRRVRYSFGGIEDLVVANLKKTGFAHAEIVQEYDHDWGSHMTNTVRLTLPQEEKPADAGERSAV